MGLQADGEFDGFEAALACGGHLGVEVEVRCFEELACDVELDPAGGSELWVLVVAKVGLLAGVGVLDDFPAVAGEVGAVNDESADGAFARGLF